MAPKPKGNPGRGETPIPSNLVGDAVAGGKVSYGQINAGTVAIVLELDNQVYASLEALPEGIAALVQAASAAATITLRANTDELEGDFRRADGLYGRLAEQVAKREAQIGQDAIAAAQLESEAAVKTTEALQGQERTVERLTESYQHLLAASQAASKAASLPVEAAQRLGVAVSPQAAQLAAEAKSRAASYEQQVGPAVELAQVQAGAAADLSLRAQQGAGGPATVEMLRRTSVEMEHVAAASQQMATTLIADRAKELEAWVAANEQELSVAAHKYDILTGLESDAQGRFVGGLEARRAALQAETEAESAIQLRALQRDTAEFQSVMAQRQQISYGRLFQQAGTGPEEAAAAARTSANVEAYTQRRTSQGASTTPLTNLQVQAQLQTELEAADAMVAKFRADLAGKPIVVQTAIDQANLERGYQEVLSRRTQFADQLNAVERTKQREAAAAANAAQTAGGGGPAAGIAAAGQEAEKSAGGLAKFNAGLITSLSIVARYNLIYGAMNLVTQAIGGVVAATEAANDAQFELSKSARGSAGELKAFADTAANAAGRSRVSGEAAIADLSKLRNEYGLTNAQIKQLEQASLDLAAVNDKDVVAAANAVSLAIRGQSRTLEGYGITLNQHAIKELSQATEEQRKNFDQLGATEQAQIRVNELLRQAAVYHGAAADYAGNQISAYHRLGAEITNLATIIGADLQSAFQNVAIEAGGVVTTVTELVKILELLHLRESQARDENEAAGIKPGVGVGFSALGPTFVQPVPTVRLNPITNEPGGPPFIEALPTPEQDAERMRRQYQATVASGINATGYGVRLQEPGGFLPGYQDTENVYNIIKKAHDEVLALEVQARATARNVQAFYGQEGTPFTGTPTADTRKRIADELKKDLGYEETAQKESLRNQAKAVDDHMQHLERAYRQDADAAKASAKHKQDDAITALKAEETELVRRRQVEDESRAATRRQEDVDRQESQRGETQALDDAHTARMRALDDEATAARNDSAERQRGIDQEKKGARDAHDARMRGIDQEKQAAQDAHDATIKNLDDERDAALAAIQVQLDGIDAVANARARAREDEQNAESLAGSQKQLALAQAGTVGEGGDFATAGAKNQAIVEAQQAVAKGQEQIDDTALQRQEDAQRTALNLQADTIKKKHDADVEAANDSLKVVQQGLDAEKQASDAALKGQLDNLDKKSLAEAADLAKKLKKVEDEKRAEADQTTEEKRQLEERQRAQDEAVTNTRAKEDAARQRQRTDEDTGYRLAEKAVNERYQFEIDTAEATRDNLINIAKDNAEAQKKNLDDQILHVTDVGKKLSDELDSWVKNGTTTGDGIIESLVSQMLAQPNLDKVGTAAHSTIANLLSGMGDSLGTSSGGGMYLTGQAAVNAFVGSLGARYGDVYQSGYALGAQFIAGYNAAVGGQTGVPAGAGEPGGIAGSDFHGAGTPTNPYVGPMPRAFGGDADAGRMYLVGERGRPELFVPRRSGHLYASPGEWAATLARSADGANGGSTGRIATSISIGEVHVHDEADETRFIDGLRIMMENDLEQAARQGVPQEAGV